MKKNLNLLVCAVSILIALCFVSCKQADDEEDEFTETIAVDTSSGADNSTAEAALEEIFTVGRTFSESYNSSTTYSESGELIYSYSISNASFTELVTGTGADGITRSWSLYTEPIKYTSVENYNAYVDSKVASGLWTYEKNADTNTIIATRAAGSQLLHYSLFISGLIYNNYSTTSYSDMSLMTNSDKTKIRLSYTCTRTDADNVNNIYVNKFLRIFVLN